nr:proline-rich membrane anchor 1 isoform X2 [Manis javanica]
MLLRDLVLRRGCCWPSLLLHCAFHPFWGFVQVTHGEPQKSCSKVTNSCQHICQCRPPPPLPPPPPPPPPPRLLSAPAPNSTSCPAEESWSGLLIAVAVCCASLVFLTVLVIICYKAIKRQKKTRNSPEMAQWIPSMGAVPSGCLSLAKPKKLRSPWDAVRRASLPEPRAGRRQNRSRGRQTETAARSLLCPSTTTCILLWARPGVKGIRPRPLSSTSS